MESVVVKIKLENAITTMLWLVPCSGARVVVGCCAPCRMTPSSISRANPGLTTHICAIWYTSPMANATVIVSMTHLTI
ncbi:hypothetical protein V1517DRAFT_321746 [Lipomyces orientalis]|uniref:Uncharacterized protein n=1 Tax=Lipomyces orientalis TaxID=1233043 RepID=A0ACC3TP31_9ASCO